MADPKSPRPRLFPRWFTACSRGALVAIVLINLFYLFGASGFAFRGTSFSFKREYDQQLYAIDDLRAFVVGKNSISIVKYRPGPMVFRLCGACKVAGTIFGPARFRKGDWIYSEFPWIKGPAAYNLRTEETVTLDVPDPKNSKIDPDEVPFYREHQLTFDKELRLTQAKVESKFEYLSTVNEMCTILQVAAFIVLAVFALITAVLLPFGLARRRAA